MNGVAQAAALISAVVCIAATPFKLFFFSRPRVRAALRVEAHNLADVRMFSGAARSEARTGAALPGAARRLVNIRGAIDNFGVLRASCAIRADSGPRVATYTLREQLPA